MGDNPKELKEKIRNTWLPKPKTPLEKRLEKAIHDFLQWMIEKGYSDCTVEGRERVLKKFLLFVLPQKIGWHDIFTWEMLTAFKKTGNMKYGSDAVTALSRYLYSQKELPSPIKKPIIRLPRVYEDYLSFFEKSRQPSGRRIQQVRSVFNAFHDYLNPARLSAVTIVDIDAFFTGFDEGLARATKRAYRSILRGFLRYLYDRGILKKDLSEMVVMAPVFGFSKPPSFLRPDEVQTLYDYVNLSCPSGLRTYAMLNLAHLLGLRGKEISLITLDDISFGRAEISIKNRKCANPIKLPLPEAAIKAIAAYIVGARPKSQHRRLFLSLMPPYGSANIFTSTLN